MKSQPSLLLAAAALLVICGVGATTNSGFKFGVVDVDQAISATQKGKDAREQLMRKMREADAKLQKLWERYRTLSEELNAQRFVLSEDKLREKEIERAQIENEIVNERRKMEGDLKIEQERLVGPLRSNLVEIVLEIGRKQGFGLIVARGTPGVMYTSEAEDITNLVIGELNRKS